MDYLQYNNPQFPLDEKSLNYDIMLSLDDVTLANLCATDSAMRLACLDDNFWRLKLERMLGRTVAYEPPTGYSWRSIYQQNSRYFNETNQWVYVLVTGRTMDGLARHDTGGLTSQVFNDPLVAYNRLLTVLFVDLGVPIEQLLTMDLDTMDLHRRQYSIYVVKLGENVNVDNGQVKQSSLIFKVKDVKLREKSYINPLINYYPVLTVPSLIMQYEGLTFDQISDRSLSKAYSSRTIYLTIHNIVNGTSVEFYNSTIGFIERWVLPTPLLLTNTLVGQVGWLLVVLDPVNILPIALNPRQQLRGKYLPRDVTHLLVNSQVFPLTHLINYI